MESYGSCMEQSWVAGGDALTLLDRAGGLLALRRGLARL